MTVRIVTDSLSDLPEDIVRELGITVVPMMVNFGDESYRDGVDLGPEQFYDKLEVSENFPTTSVVLPDVFASAYDTLAQETDEILVLTVSSKLAATYNVALKGVGLMKRKCRVDVVDTRWVTMAMGFIVMAAAKAARAGDSIEKVKKIAEKTISRVDLRATFNTLEYLRRGGRIGRASAFLGSMLKVNPIITVRNGEVDPVGRTRSRLKAMDQLYEFVRSYARIEAVAVEDTDSPYEADALVERLGAIYPKEHIYRTKMTPAIGVHTGPGLLLVAVQGELPSRV